MHMKTSINNQALLWTAVGICIGLALCFALKHAGYSGRGPHKPQMQMAAGQYKSAHVGVSFAYPDTYDLVSRHVGEGHLIMLMPRGYVAPVGGEGPAMLTVQEFVNNEGLPLEKFIRQEPMTNFGLSNGATERMEMDGREGLSYRYSGLYETDAVAVASANKVFVFAAGWASEDDPLRQEFIELLKTVQFTDHAY